MSEFGGLRLKYETIENLKDLKNAFEESYETRLTMDMFMEKLISCCSTSEPEIWDLYQTITEQKNSLREKIMKAREKKHQNR